MPRRQSIPRMTKYQTIPANRTTARFTAKLMSDGKRNLSDRILREALARAEAQSHRPGLEVLEAALRNATPIIEVKPRRVGGATYQVPVEIRGERRMSLGVRWLVQAARKRSGKSMSEKLAAELVDAMNGLGAAVKRREDTHKMAEANRPSAISSGRTEELREHRGTTGSARTHAEHRNHRPYRRGQDDRHRADPLLHEEDLQDR